MSEPEAYPVKERITQAIVAALKTIKTDNGYRIDIADADVIRPRRTGQRFVPTAGPDAVGVAVMQSDASRETADDRPGNPPVIAWRMPVSCDVVVRTSESSEVPVDQAVNIAEAEVQRALMTAGEGEVVPTFGGLAIGAELQDSEYPPKQDGVEGITVWIDVIYRVPENDPFTAAR